LFTPAKNKRNRSATPANRNHHSRSSTAFYQGAIMPPSCLQPAVSTRQNRPLPELIFPVFFLAIETNEISSFWFQSRAARACSSPWAFAPHLHWSLRELWHLKWRGGASENERGSRVKERARGIVLLPKPLCSHQTSAMLQCRVSLCTDRTAPY
jgi:hypothetical protein